MDYAALLNSGMIQPAAYISQQFKIKRPPTRYTARPQKNDAHRVTGRVTLTTGKTRFVSLLTPLLRPVIAARIRYPRVEPFAQVML